MDGTIGLEQQQPGDARKSRGTPHDKKTDGEIPLRWLGPKCLSRPLSVLCSVARLNTPPAPLQQQQQQQQEEARSRRRLALR
jgi:hypothetical protein